MKISIVTLSMMPGNKLKFYNAQDTGLGRALADAGNDVDIFHFVPEGSASDESVEQLSDRLRFHKIPAKSVGVHSIYRRDFIPDGTEGVVCFSDNQINFGRILGFCRKRNIRCLPYVGVLGSNNDSRLKGMLMNMVADNVKYYRNMTVLAKTPKAAEELQARGAASVVVAPVCLDNALLNKDYADTDINSIRAELGAAHGMDFTGKVILYVGRFNQEKQPVEMVDVFGRIRKAIPSSKLVMIGSGPLEAEVKARITGNGLQDCVTVVDRVANNLMWKYYRMADVVVNLNQHEIFGMSILEAMYYERRVAAIRSPGPEFIIQSPLQGTLCDSISGVVDAVCDQHTVFDGKAAHERILNNFLWNVTADIIMRQF